MQSLKIRVSYKIRWCQKHHLHADYACAVTTSRVWEKTQRRVWHATEALMSASVYVQESQVWLLQRCNCTIKPSLTFDWARPSFEFMRDISQQQSWAISGSRLVKSQRIRHLTDGCWYKYVGMVRRSMAILQYILHKYKLTAFPSVNCLL